MKTFFSTPCAYPWTHAASAHFRGYFIVAGKLYRGTDAITYLCQRLSAQTQPELVFRELNGLFSFVCERDGATLFTVDRLRGLPLFYAVIHGDLWVSDSAEAIASELPVKTVSPEAKAIYASSKLFVAGKNTLIQEIFQVEASCFCLHQAGSHTVEEFPYFAMRHEKFETDPAVLIPRFQEAYCQAGKALVQALSGRTAVVPLSGGADSRMVLSMLKQQGYEKVFCFTYGREGNAESEISRKVAEHFGYPWTMVVYTREKWRALRNSSVFQEYRKTAFNYVSTPHVLDFLAVKELKEGGMLPADSVFVPGHSGDMIAGSHITPEFLRNRLSRPEFLRTVFEHFFSDASSPEVQRQVQQRFPVCSEDSMETMAAQSEWFNVQERQAKFIVNAVRVYEFFGYEWLIPLWDNALFEFWRHVPISLRYHRRLYFMAVNDRTIPSTNDRTGFRRFTDGIRKIPGVRTLARRSTRVIRYWNSQHHMEALFPVGPYLKGCLEGDPMFDINHLLCQQQIDETEQNIHEDE